MIKKFMFAKLVLLVLVLSLTTFGQETTGGIEGTVKDPAGAVVPNITVTIETASQTASGTTTTGTGAGFRRTVTANDEGFFRALQVPPGVYTVSTAASSGFGETRYENVTVTLGQNTQLAIAVSPGTTTTSVDVSVSDAPPVDTTNNAIQTSINAQKIELIPKSTGFTGLLKTVPGTRPESRTGGFSVDGASGGENVFVIDGQEVSNYRTGTLNEAYNLPTQLVQEVQVKSSGFNAEYGGATGGVVSVVTKGGSNDFHGEAGIQFETPKFNGTPRPLLNRLTKGTVGSPTNPFAESVSVLDPAKSQGTNVFPTVSLGGPILKDRLWFYGNYSPQVFDTIVDTQYFANDPVASTFITSERYHRKRTYEYAFARLDSSPFENLRVSSTFLWNPVVDNGSIPATSFSNTSSSAIGFLSAPLFELPSANFGGSIGKLFGNDYTDKQGGRQNSNLVTVDGTYTPTSSLVFNARYSRGFLNEKLGNYFVPEVPFVATCVTLTGFTCSTNAANNITRRDVSLRTNYEFSAAYLFEGLGRHELKGGYQRFTIFNDVASGNTTTGRLTFSGTLLDTLIGRPSTPGAIGTGTFRRQGTNGSGSNLSQGIYIQDKYQPISRLTLNLGVRFEQENLPSFNEFPSAINFGWGDKIAPRLGFAYDIFGDGKTKVFASYGLFYDRVKFELPRGLFGGDIFLEDYFEIFPGDNAANFNIVNVVGGFTGPSICPPTGFIIAGALSRCQKNLRVNANEPAADPFESGAVDPNLRPFRQSEFTVGVERQLSQNYVLRARYTFKNVDEAVEDAGIINSGGNEAYIIGNPGRGLHLETLQALGYTKSTRPQRRYDGLEFVLEKRLSRNWYFNANYTWSRLFGNYTGLASSDEPHLVNGRTSPGVTRAFDLPFIGFTARGEKDNGLLPTDRTHVFNVYGAYIFNWMGSTTNSTEFSGFQTVTSGTPMTTSIYGASSVTPQILFGRGDLGRSPMYTQTDFNITHRYRFGRDNRFTLVGDLNFLNLFDQDAVTGIYPTMNPSTASVSPNALGAVAAGPWRIPGMTPQIYANRYVDGTLLENILGYMGAAPDRNDERYGQAQLFQSPRVVRFGFRFLF